MKYILTLLTFLGLSYSLFAQEATPDFERITDYDKKMDSLKKYCNVLLGSDSSKGDNFPQALIYGLKGLRLAKKDDHNSIAQFALITGVSYYNRASFDSASYYIKIATKESAIAKNTVLLSWSYSNMIPIYLQTQQAAAADSVAETLKSITDTAKNIAALTKCYYGLGNYYYFKSYYATAQSYFLKSLGINQKISDTSHDNRYRSEYAVQSYMLYKIYGNNELFDKALAALKDGSRYMTSSSALVLRYNSAYVDAYTNPASANIDSALKYYNKLAEIPKNAKGIASEYVMSNIAVAQYYVKNKNFPEALIYVDRAMALAEESKAPFLMHQAQNMKGIYKFNTGAYDEAIELLEKALPLSKQVNKGNYLESVHLIGQSYRAKGNLAKAMEYYDLYDAEKDEYTKTNMNRYFADLEIQYRMKEKERQIFSLSAENQVRQLELRNATRLRIFLISGLIAFGIISLLLYRVYRNKEKLNKELNERNKELDKLNASLAIANESKAKLFGIFSHDLRSPVSKIAQFLRLQKENPDLFNDNARSEYHEKFTNVTAHLLNTMEDLLLWSKSQMENFSPEYHSVYIKQVANRELALLTSQIEEKELKVENLIPESFLSITDENFVNIIFRNLLQNAVRYSHQNAVVTLKAGENAVSITNKSTSLMTADSLNELMKKGEVSSNNFGLGLQIARDLAERIGIRIFFEETEKGFVTAVLKWEQ
jgi:signal transduction histidine kinase